MGGGGNNQLCGCLAAGWGRLTTKAQRTDGLQEVCKWAVVFSLLCLRRTCAEVTWSLLVTELGLCSCFATFTWSGSNGCW